MDAIIELQNRLSGAYARNTLRGYAADLRIFQAWCVGQGLEWLPATPNTVVAFITAEASSSSVATINRRISAIARLHRAFGHDDPVKSEAVHLALRRIRRQKPRRPRQALGLTAAIRDAMIAACPDTLAGKRDRALVMLAYDTLRRRSELVELRIEDIHPLDEGAAILVRRSKTDQEGKGHLAYLSPLTLEAIDSWLTATALDAGPILRSVLVRGRVGERLNASGVSPLLKQIARRAGLPSEVADRLSGHSPRVGAAQDMAANGIDIGSIMQAGGWQSETMVARYIANLEAARSGMSRLWQLRRQSTSQG